MFCFANLEFLVGAYPESNQATDDAVLRYRNARTEVDPSTPGFLSFDENIVAISARLGPLFDLGRWFMEYSRAMRWVLWPKFPLNVTPFILCNWLASALARIREWHRSAALAGSRRALEFVASWYPDISMEVLAAKREAGPVDPAAQQHLHDRACIISSYTETDEFIPAVEGEFVLADDSGVEYISSGDGVQAEDAPAGGEGVGSSSVEGNGAGGGGEAQSRAEPEADVAPPQ